MRVVNSCLLHLEIVEEDSTEECERIINIIKKRPEEYKEALLDAVFSCFDEEDYCKVVSANTSFYEDGAEEPKESFDFDFEE
jgi:hypothetical protein